MKGFKNCCTSNALDGNDDDDDDNDDMFCNDNEKHGDVRSVRKIEGLTVKMETVTLIGR